MKKFEKLISLWPFAILIVASMIAIAPFLNSGFFPVHDDAQVQRVFEMKKALTDGMFPVRWVADLGYGYGYPIFNFYSPLPYYIGAFISLLGLEVLSATKVMIAASIVGSSFAMYSLAKEFWGKLGGLFSAVLYQFVPYHAINTYVRGDVGELYAYFFIPLIFYGIWKYYKEESFRYLLIGALSYAGLITSHNLSAMMVSPFILVTILLLFVIKRKLSLFVLPLIGILLSSFYFIPALLEINYTNVFSVIGGGSDFRDHFVCFPQLWYSPWGFAGSAPGCIDGMSLEIGKIHIIFTTASLVLAAFFRKYKEKFWVLLLSLLAFVLSVFMMTQYSTPIWEALPPMKFFQFPWRFLLLASFFSSFASGALIFFTLRFHTNQKYRNIFYLGSMILILIPFIFYSRLFNPQEYLNKNSQDYVNKDYLNWTTSRISDEYMPKSFDTPENKNEIIKNKISGDVRIANLSSNTKELSVDLESPERTKIVVHIPYFPAWNYYLNGKKVSVYEVPTGVSFDIPQGRSRLDARFEQTGTEKSANLLSLSGVGLITLGIIYSKKRKKNEKINS